MLNPEVFKSRIRELRAKDKLPSFMILNYDGENDLKVRSLLLDLSTIVLNKKIDLGSFGKNPNIAYIESKSKSFLLEQIHPIKNFLDEARAEQAKVCFINSASKLTELSMNKLLKSLEEPNYNSFIFLLNSNNAHLLPTIKSRGISFKLNFESELEEKISLPESLWAFFDDASKAEKEYLHSFARVACDDSHQYKQKKQVLGFLKWFNENNALQLPVKERLYHLFYLWKNIEKDN